MSYIAWITCPVCKIAHIENPQSITVFLCDDAIEQHCEIQCPNCMTVVKETLDRNTIEYFKFLDCNVKQFGDQFALLTEAMIDDWDIEAELAKELV